MAMDDVFEGRWKQLKGDVKRFWGNLPDDDLDRPRATATSSSAPCRSVSDGRR